MNNLIPTKCPYCGEELAYDGINLICNNQECLGIISTKIESCVTILGIKGMGRAMIDDMVSHGWTYFFDIFFSNFRKSMIDNGLTVSANVKKVFDSIDLIKTIDLYKLIMLCGFDGMGETTAKQVARKLAGISYDYTGLDRNVCSGFGDCDEKSRTVVRAIRYLRRAGIEVEFPKEDEQNNSIGIEFTGSPKPLFNTKDEFLSFIEKSGYKHVKIAEAEILITDSMDSDSSKMKIAKKKGLEIYTYEDFTKKINDERH